jgi:predicted RNA-binding Zn-ribbon protein involved in translation (DUF1610 family)
LDKVSGGKRKDKIPPLCPACGYNLTGAVSERCPECGRPIVRKGVRRQAADTEARLVELEGVNDLASLGLKIGILGAGLRLGGLAMGWGPTRGSGWGV